MDTPSYESGQTHDYFKRAVKFGISSVYLVCCSFGRVIGHFLGRTQPPKCTILYYHAISTEDRERFAKQMDLVARLTTPIHVDSSTTLTPGTLYSGVTFDDGFRELIDNALPELRKRHIPCTIFVIANALGQIPRWKTGRDDSHHYRLMTLSEMRSLPSDLVSIGAHTLTHPDLRVLSAKDAKEEISESRVLLQRLLDEDVDLFSFPYGAFDEPMIAWCREAGYKRVFTTIPQNALSNPDEFLTGRVWAEPSDWPMEFRLKLLGAYEWLPYGFRLKRWIRAVLNMS